MPSSERPWWITLAGDRSKPGDDRNDPRFRTQSEQYSDEEIGVLVGLIGYCGCTSACRSYHPIGNRPELRAALHKLKEAR